MKRCTYHSKVEVLSPEQERCRTADPRNPQPGQTWRRDGHENTVEKVCYEPPKHPLTGKYVMTLWTPHLLCKGHGFVTYLNDWRSWACPWWRRRKHWARCVEWE